VLHRISLTLRFPEAKAPARLGAKLQAPRNLRIIEEAGGIVLYWDDDNSDVQGYNLYADYNVLVDQVNPKAVTRRWQKLSGVDKGRTYRFYLRPLGSDGKEGPASDVLEYRAQ
jgi:hypothetical protein